MKTAVVIPMPSDPPEGWKTFQDIPEDVDIIVVDDTLHNQLHIPLDMKNTIIRIKPDTYSQDWAVRGSAACRNKGHFFAYKEGYDNIIALDYDCRPAPGWVEQHLAHLGYKHNVDSLQGAWINTLRETGAWARGYPYEYRTLPPYEIPGRYSGIVALHVGLWWGILDCNGIDKLQEPFFPVHPVDTGSHVALGNFPVCGMNTSFLREVTPLYYFLPNVEINGWTLSRHDDIWGGYIANKLLNRMRIAASFGQPFVEHLKQTPLEKVVVHEHYMHILSTTFYFFVDTCIDMLTYAECITPTNAYANFVHYFTKMVHALDNTYYKEPFKQLAKHMNGWVQAFV